MNELLQKHGCSNVFSVPEGLRELMADITREVLRAQPEQLYDFITNYLSALLITREHGVLSVRILDDLCDCRPSLSESLIDAGLPADKSHTIAEVIHSELKGQKLDEGKETVKEATIIKKVLQLFDMDENTTAKVCNITRNAYRDYIYRKQIMSKRLRDEADDEPWQKAAEHTLRIYKTTKPSFAELTRAAQIIQAAYRGYHVRRNMLAHLRKPPVDRSTTPVDIAGSREIDLGSMLAIDPEEDNVEDIFSTVPGVPMIPHVKSSKLLSDMEKKSDEKSPTDAMASKLLPHVCKSVSIVMPPEGSVEQPDTDSLAAEPTALEAVPVESTAGETEAKRSTIMIPAPEESEAMEPTFAEAASETAPIEFIAAESVTQEPNVAETAEQTDEPQNE